MQVSRNDEQQLITINNGARVIHHQHAVTVAVEGDTQVCFFSQHSRLQRLHMRRAAVVVDVQTIRLGRQHRNVGAQLFEHTRGNLVGRAVGAVENHFQAAKVGTGRHTAFAELDITTGRIIDTRHFAKLVRIHNRHLRVEQLFDHQLNFIGELGTLTREELDAVVIMRVVRRTDHDASFCMKSSREVSNGRCRHWPQKHDICPRSRQARFQRRFKHVTRNTRVLAHQNPASTHATKRHTRCPTQLEHEVRGNRINADATANTVGAKILLRHKCSIILSRRTLPLRSSVPHQPFRPHHGHAKYARPWSRQVPPAQGCRTSAQ